MDESEYKPAAEEANNQPKFKTFDDILLYVGDAGRYQWLLFLILLPFTVILTFVYFGQYFLTLIPEEHWCKVPQFEGTNLTDSQKISLSVPLKSAVKDEAASYVSYSRCQMYIANYTEVLITGKKPALDTPIERCQYGWSFDQTIVPYLSIAAELEWVCDNAHLVTTAQSIFFVGSMVGGFIFGYVADHYGRRPALIACNGVALVAFIGTTFTNSFWSFAIVRFIAGTAYDNCFNIIFIIAMEYVGPKYRKFVINVSMGVYFAITMSLLPWIAYWLSDWRMLSIVSAIPLTIVFVTPWIVPESARWYVQHDRIDEAMEMFKKVAKINKRTVTKEILVDFEKTCKAMKMETSDKANTVLDLFKYCRLGRITMVLIVNWFLTIFVFDALVWNMKALHPNIFVSFSFTAISEFPATIVVTLLLDILGRRWMCFLSMFICGVVSLITVVVPFGTAAMCTAALARSGAIIALNIELQQSAEILPTVVRVQGVSLIHIVGTIAHILGPNITLLANIAPSLPLILIGISSLVSAFLSLTLPETTNEELPDTLEDGNNFGKEQSFWLVPCIRKD